MGKYDNSWTGAFTQNVVDAGWDYYIQGKAKNLVETEYGFHARVRGKRNYQVDIFLNYDYELQGGDCNCAEGQNYVLCKHMAATLFLIESEYEPIDGLDPEYFELDYEAADQKHGSVPVEDQKHGFASENGQKHGSVPENNRKDESEHGNDRNNKSAPEGGLENADRSFGNWLAELDQIQKKETKLFLEENPQADQETNIEEYRYFRYESFREGLDISKKTWKMAQDLLNRNELCNIKVEVGFSTTQNNPHMIGMITGSDYFGYHNTRLYFNRKHITDGYCNKWDCHYRSSSKCRIGHKLCEHEVALLLYLEDYIKNHNPGDSSNQDGMKLIHYMAGDLSNERANQEEKGQMLELVPILHFNPSKGYTVSFKVGAGRLYVVKKLSEFMDHVNENKVMVFGKNTQYLLGRAWFDSYSLSLLDFIDHVLEEDAQLRNKMKAGYEDGLPSVTGQIPLYGNNMDEFFDLMGPTRPLEFDNKYFEEIPAKSTIRCRESDYQASLTIQMDTEKKTGVFQGIHLSGKLPHFVYGQRFAYFMEEGCLCRVPIQKIKGLKPLQSLQFDGDIDVRIGRRHLSSFYNKVLPKLREVADVKEYDTEIISRYLPAEPVFLCYLDVLGNMILCRVDVIYGNNVHHLVEEIATQRVIKNYRNIEKEDELLNYLYNYFPHIDVDHMLFFSEKEEENIFLFLSEGLSKLLEMAEVHMTDRFRRLGVRKNIKYNVGVSVDANILDLDISSMGYTKPELMEILKAYKRKATYIRLKNGDFLKIDQNESVAALAEIMDSLHLSINEFVDGKMHIPAYRALYLEKMMEQSQFIEPDRSKTFRKLIREFDTATNADYDVPEELESVLRNYQKDGYQWLSTLDHLGFGGILADEMGLGKTLQVITVLLAHSHDRDEESKTSLIVCPASLVYNWKEEISRFAPQLSVNMAVGTKDERRTIIGGCLDEDVLITSYDLLKRDINLYADKYFRFMILDEAQYIKNQTTAAAKSVKLIQARTRYALTGTPIENRLSDMWSIFDFLMPGFLFEYTVFRREYEQPIVKDGQKELSDRLSRMASPFILRRKKMNVLKDLPEKLEEIRYAGMGKTQKKLYDAHVIRLRKSLEKQTDDEFKKNRIQVLSELTKLRQLCCDPSLYYDDYDGESAKREACMALVENIVEGEHKALIFSQFTTMLELLEKDLTEAGISYYKITGSTPKEKRFAMVNAFNADDTPIFLISLKAGGTGLNLTGADVVIHYDPWWNLAVQNQATDRAHRIGQTQVVTVYKLIIKETIEERIIEMQESKKQLAEDILGGENIGSTTISKEDLLALL